MNKYVKVVVFFIFPVLALLLLMEGAFTSRVEPGSTPIETQKVQGVQVEEIKRQSKRGQGAIIPGTVISAETATVSSKLMATVTSVYVTKGTVVKQGDPLVMLDPAQVRSAQNQAQAQVAGAQAAINTLQDSIAVAKTGVEKAGINVEQMRVKRDHAEKSYQRVKKLYDAGAASKQDYDNAYTEYMTAQNGWLDAKKGLDQARANLAVMNTRKGEVNAQYQVAMAGFETTNISVGDATIRAPFDGIITEKLVHTGDVAAPGTPLVYLDKAPYYLAIDVDERKMGQVKLDDTLRVHIDAVGYKGEGKVVEITPRVDPASRKFQIKLSLPTNLHITSGMYGQAVIPDAQDDAIYLPQSALVSWSQFTGVYVVDEKNIAHLTFVNTTPVDESFVEVLSGVEVGDRIVVGSVERVRDKVKVVEQP